jgi:hypothetical protein
MVRFASAKASVSTASPCARVTMRSPLSMLVAPSHGVAASAWTGQSRNTAAAAENSLFKLALLGG